MNCSSASKESQIVYLCAYYVLKRTGLYFHDADKNFPSHLDIKTILSKISKLNMNHPIEKMMDKLGIPYSHEVLEKHRAKNLKKTKSAKRKNNHLKRIDDNTFFTSIEWRKIRYAALELHGATCQCCGRSNKKHGVILHVDHIKPRSKYPELSLKISNLQVLCEDCNLGKSNIFDTDWR